MTELHTLWRQMPPTISWERLEGESVLMLRGDGTGVMLRIDHSMNDEQTRVQTLDTRKPYRVRRFMKNQFNTAIDDMPAGATGGVYVMAPTWHIRWWARWLRYLVIACLTLAVMVPIPIPYGLVALILIPVFNRIVPCYGPVVVRSLAQLPLTSATIVDYASKRLAGAHP